MAIHLCNEQQHPLLDFLLLVFLLLLLQPSSYRSNLISEAVIGSLPQGLTETERASLSATPLAMSPALQRLQELPQVST
jgi:hypothetical protein